LFFSTKISCCIESAKYFKLKNNLYAVKHISSDFREIPFTWIPELIRKNHCKPASDRIINSFDGKVVPEVVL